MKEELFKDLKKRYEMARFIAAAKWIADEMENGDENAIEAFDARLVTIFIKDVDEEDDAAVPMLQVRLRKLEGQDEEFVLVLQDGGYTTPADEVDLKLTQIAEAIESITERMLEEYPEKALVWNWLGDD